ncbi:MAG TPA: class I SAM-dependent methyltransferase [Usitatibacter sp.]|nr:class I SAM-dependent methyltransferase [Usitatibacter sp.]
MVLRRYVRDVVRRIPPLYWLAGVTRYGAFCMQLRAEDRRHASGHFSHLPPPRLRHRVHGALDPESYANAGRIVGARIAETLLEHGIATNARVLDFACGPGRIAAAVKALQPSWGLNGSDLDQHAIAWATDYLGAVADFFVNRALPPSPFPAASFDAIYSVSLFTHLDEPTQLAWLEELERIAKPGGLVLVTTHGVATLGSCSDHERARFERDGFVFRVGRTGWLKLDGLPDTYQTAFHSRAYVERVWRRFFDVVDYREGGIAGHQDLVVLRKRLTLSSA